MGRISGLAFTVMLATAAAGCDRVYTAAPVGRNPVPLSPKAWEGRWLAETSGGGESGKTDSFVLIIEVLDQERGVLQVRGRKEDAGGSTNTDISLIVFVRSYGSMHFVSWPDGFDSDMYLWGVLRRSAEEMAVFIPEPASFRAFVEKNLLPGAVAPEGDVWLGDMSDEQLGLIARSETLFIKDHVVLLTRWKSRAGPAEPPPPNEEDRNRSSKPPSQRAPPEAGRDR